MPFVANAIREEDKNGSGKSQAQLKNQERATLRKENKKTPKKKKRARDPAPVVTGASCTLFSTLDMLALFVTSLACCRALLRSVLCICMYEYAPCSYLAPAHTPPPPISPSDHFSKPHHTSPESRPWISHNAPVLLVRYSAPRRSRRPMQLDAWTFAAGEKGNVFRMRTNMHRSSVV